MIADVCLLLTSPRHNGFLARNFAINAETH